MKPAHIIMLLLASMVGLAPAKENHASSAGDENVNRFGAYAGMGVHAVTAPGITDHLNSVNRSGVEVGRLGTGIEFFAGVEIPVHASWAVKAEHSLFFKSYTLEATTYGSEDLRYDVQSPTLMAQYVIPGRGYFIKFAAGGGYHWGTVTVRTSIYGQETLYKAHGVGGRAEAEGQTAFDSHLFGYIGASLGFEALGTPTSGAGAALTDGAGAVSLNYFTAGLRFGLMYYF